MWVRLPPRAPTFGFCFHSVRPSLRQVYGICTEIFAIQNRIQLPCARNISLKLLLARADPGVVMPLGNAHTLVSQENRDALDWHTSKQEFHCERIAEAMRDGIALTLRDSS